MRKKDSANYSKSESKGWIDNVVLKVKNSINWDISSIIDKKIL